ncbi:46 kDa FK506-binding nuclear protein [Colias croceus]|uniref:46 kDa FK506-binding nuclear protein n=1 Tax=Colias crocea TaxID=72248 RepID=UPI001E27FEFF|nr:46 kDa FK506-binding nuclear protein [Colias croceus]
MFWGLIMEPNKRYTQLVDKPFHISHAAMDISTGDNEACQVMVVVDGKNFLVCTLQKKQTIQMPLDLYFKTGENVAFLTNGKCNVHLTGYIDPEFDDEVSDEEGEEEEEEADEEEQEQAQKPAKNKRKLVTSTDSATSAKKAKKGKKAAADEDSSDSDNEDQLQKFLNGEDIDSDENDESFKINTSAEADDSDEEEDDDDEEQEAEEEEADSDDDDDDEEEADSSKADTSMDTSKDDSQIDMSKLTKNQKKRLKKKLQKEKQAQGQVNGVEKKEKAEPKQKTEKKKSEAKKEQKEEAAVEKKEKKSLSGGVFIEDVKIGNGPVAKPGKTVMVYYEGRLKQNNKMFDNCQKGPGFKFRLGAKEVISGWDVGVSGMKVGGKRKIICPPAMAYGAKGSPPVIPPNSTLVFEVELKNVK